MAPMSHLTWLPSLVAGPVLVVGSQASSSIDWATVVAIGGMVATLISAATGLIVALRHKPSVVVVTPEQAEELGLTTGEDVEEAVTLPPKRRRAPRKRKPS